MLKLVWRLQWYCEIRSALIVWSQGQWLRESTLTHGLVPCVTGMGVTFQGGVGSNPTSNSKTLFNSQDTLRGGRPRAHKMPLRLLLNGRDVELVITSSPVRIQTTDFLEHIFFS